jgi:hypothetical protein
MSNHSVIERLGKGSILAQEVLNCVTSYKNDSLSDAEILLNLESLEALAREVTADTGDYIETDVDKSFE